VKGYLFVMLVAALVTYLTTGAARRLARRIGAITPVRDRDVHSVPIPRLGGVAMYAGIAVALLTASRIPFFDPVFTTDRAAYAVIVAAGAVCLLGVFDDVWQLDAVTKLAGQSLAAGVMAWQGIQLLSIPIFGTIIPSRGVLIVLTVLIVVVTINAVNFVDGLDGLAAGIVAIAGSAFFVYSYALTRDASPDDYSSLASLVAAAVVGACLGFLPHNFNPARIFMGDSGSMLIGLLLATSTVAITGRVDPVVLDQARIVPAFLPLVLPLAVLALPLIDLGLAVVRRTRAGRMPWQPDKMHLHHRMLGIGHSHARAVLILYFWTATVGFGVALFALVSPLHAVLLAAACVVAGSFLTLGPLRSRRSVRETTAAMAALGAPEVALDEPGEPGPQGEASSNSGGTDDDPGRTGERTVRVDDGPAGLGDVPAETTVRANGVPVRADQVPVAPEAVPARPATAPVRPDAAPGRPKGPGGPGGRGDGAPVRRRGRRPLPAKPAGTPESPETRPSGLALRPPARPAGASDPERRDAERRDAKRRDAERRDPERRDFERQDTERQDTERQDTERRDAEGSRRDPREPGASAPGSSTPGAPGRGGPASRAGRS
jgi:UDP-GlcNAc:undecaprenyl-phosphate/decaprenyl-phosphate GlcNAc-1-phosphate transferase